MDSRVDFEADTSLKHGLMPPVYSPTTAAQTNHKCRKLPASNWQTTGAPEYRQGGMIAIDKWVVLRVFIVLCLLVAIGTGFGLMYYRMVELDRQVQDLRKLTAIAELGLYGDFEDYEEGPDRIINPETKHGDSESHESGEDGRHRGRRSVSRGSRVQGYHSIHHQGGASRYTSHVVPYTPVIATSRAFHSSEWFRWTAQDDFAHARIPLRPDGLFLEAPVSGYYHIYAQMTHVARTESDLTYSQGFSINIKPRCGESPTRALIKSYTTPATPQLQNVTRLNPRDSNYAGGIFYLSQGDFVGVKPTGTSFNNRFQHHQGARNSFFGAVLLHQEGSQYQTVYCPP